MIDEATPTIRYSPRPLTEYSGSVMAPANDRRVDKPEIWNLAYLSLDYEKTDLHPDATFLTHVRRTCQYNMRQGRVQLAGAAAAQDLVGHIFLRPAPWAVRWLQHHTRVLVNLPLYQAYGQAWIAEVERRSRLCHDYDYEPDSPIHTVEKARVILGRFGLSR